MTDLFDYPELQNQSVRRILWAYGCPQDYEGCDLLIQKLNEVGYTCEYGLDASPYNLRKIEYPSLSYEDRAHLMWALNNQI